MKEQEARINLRVPVKWKDRLMAYANRHDLSASQVVRQAVSLLLAHETAGTPSRGAKHDE